MRRAGALLFLLPVAASGYEVGSHWLRLREVPSAADWRAAAQAVRREKAPGDLVVAAPHWIRQTAYMHLGDDLVPLRDAARADASTYSRLWVVSIRDAQAPEARGRRVDLDRRFGDVRVRRYRLPRPARLVYDFVDRLADARVALVRGAAPKACPWTPPGRWRVGRFVCDPRRAWNRVSERVMDDLRHRPRRGIWAHPVAGRTLVVDFADVPLASVLRGYTGLGYEAARLTGDFPPVRLQIFLDGRPTATVFHHQHDVWKRFEIDTGARRGQRARVRFEIWAERPGMRHFYFVADTRDP